MRTKTAILQVADTGPLESLVVMLRSAGYRCKLPGQDIRDALRKIGCDTVLEIKSLVESWGYDQPIPLEIASLDDMHTADLFVDIKAHRNGRFIKKRWPNLKKKLLWYRINGGMPEHVIRSDGFDCGDEINPPCPILTPNQWYKDHETNWSPDLRPHLTKAYTCWPPFFRYEDHNYPRVNEDRVKTNPHYEPPICLVHNLRGWGYGPMVEQMNELGISLHGVNSPNGLINHREVPVRLSKVLCMVHLKSSDAPGYALYEALASACPIIVSRKLIWKNKMEEMFIPYETCLVFNDRETHDPFSQEDISRSIIEIKEALSRLRNSDENRRIGNNGRAQLKKLMWSVDNPEHVKSFQSFMEKAFPD